MRRASRAVAAAAVLASIVSGCGVGDKQALADAVHGSVDEVVKAKTAVGSVNLELTLDEDALPAAVPGTARPARRAEIAGDVGFDLASGSVLVRTSFTPPAPAGEAAAPPADGAAPPPAAPAEGAAAPAPEGAPPAPAPEGAPPAPPAPAAVTTEAVFRGGVVIVKRPNLRPSDRRTWAKLDYTRLPDDERLATGDEEPPAIQTLATVAPTVNPRYILDLARGALAGSMELAGKEQVAGVETTRYKARVSIDKALTDLDLSDEERATRELMFRLVGIVEDVRPAEFWLDAEGRPRRMRFDLRARKGRNITHELVITLELREFGTPVEAPAPTAEETVQVQRYGRLIRNVLPAGSI